MTQENIQIPNDEWEEVLNILDEFTSLTYVLQRLGVPRFMEGIPTAALVFDKQGNDICIGFSPKLWNRCNPFERAFVMAHELLHGFFQHGTKFISVPEEQRPAMNVATDICINHILEDFFHFDRAQLPIAQDLCWLDTIFKDDPSVLKHQTAEYYFFKLLKDNRFTSITYILLGNHSVDDPEAQQKIKDFLDQVMEKSPDVKVIISKLPSKQAGTGEGELQDIFVGRVQKINKWRKFFKKLSKTTIEMDEMWGIASRRQSLLSSELLLPGEMQQEVKAEPEVLLFLDVSGSCMNIVPWFIKARKSFPTEIKVTACTFDTDVDLLRKNDKINMGGGTYFHILEEYIQQQLKSGLMKKYPVHVMVFTDGYGTDVHPQYPERWIWMLSEDMRINIPKASKIYMLSDIIKKD